jgi:hypothetical protein
MNFLDLFTLHNLALLSDWFEDAGELYVDINLPHSGASSTPYFVRSLQDLKELVAQQDWPEISITIFHRRQYPLRGIVGGELIAKALDYVHDNEWYMIVSPKDYYPSRCIFYGSGNSHAELRQELQELAGELVGIGRDPFDYDTTWFHFSPDIFIVSMTKNQTYYEPFAQHPDKYEWVKKMWWK